MRHVFDAMGTTVSLEAADSLETAERSDAAERVFGRFDAIFSLFRPESELSRIADGRLALADSSESVREAYGLALEWRSATGGAFTPHRPDGAIDLNGIVKALAIERAGALLGGDWILNAGGDILIGGRERVIGIADPADRDSLLCSVALRGSRRAIATSGGAERGDHIWGRSDFAQVTVVADDIVTADVLATAIVAGGTDLLDDATRHWDVDVLTVDRRGELRATPGLRVALAA